MQELEGEFAEIQRLAISAVNASSGQAVSALASLRRIAGEVNAGARPVALRGALVRAGFPAAIECSESEDPDVRAAADEALLEMAHHESVGTVDLARMLTIASSIHGWGASEVAESLVRRIRLRAEHMTSAVRDAMQFAFRATGDESVAALAAEELFRMGEVAPLVAALGASAPAGQRLAALRGMEGDGALPPGVVERCRGLARDGDVQVRVAVARLLRGGDPDDRVAVVEIMDLLSRDTEVLVRSAAMHAVPRLSAVWGSGGECALCVQWLRCGMSDPGSDVRFAAVQATSGVGRETLERLLPVLKWLVAEDPELLVRWAARDAIADE